ncbi:protein SODIUM POTASSIUM ROOT DEFECTIVE 1-like [Tasmannia lanceolata]|uniref:protein SODIUM POTASSIUM ROOT DEFECTIVE 1-like n=1 Tax=Tasmannia lanceolata TaxID=3420 RepID=UPI00406364EB
MNGIELICASPDSTAIYMNMDQNSTIPHGGRALDRHTPRLIDPRRTKAPHPSSSTSKSKSYPKKSRKSSTKQNDLTSPPSSSRFLLSDASFFNVLSDFDPDALVLPESESFRSLKEVESTVWSQSTEPTTSKSLKEVESTVWSQSTAPAEPTRSSLKEDESALQSRPIKDEQSAILQRSHEQVVVLKVSLHCKGCEGKVRKHISRMEGVKSFNIDFSTKKVTVIGDVTPLGVLSSISRVKSAQFWPSSSSLSSLPSSSYIS